ncbi:MAG: carboxypeptidase regulatory-like domain-containing protein [Candidatus Hydrogenedentes bacterium]|nr:carboxypeptidase regulatory-like domain-containing protein [Candidatus Hydrogenedentota bacterium]
MQNQSAFKYFATALLLLLAPACNRSVVIQGTVTDIQGEELPGVAITITGAPYETLSNVLGKYTLRCAPGNIEMIFLKSGFTPGVLRVEAQQRDALAVKEMVLWPLPPRPGVYAFKNFRYEETTRIEPKRYKVKSGGQVFATKKAPDLLIGEAQPQLIAYKLPPFDAQIYRLEQVPARQPEATGETYPETVWAPVESVPVLSTPIDEPERLLLELQVSRPLESGAYAVHWGALDGYRMSGAEGYRANESLIYLFRVVDPEEEAKIRAEAQAEAEAETVQRREKAESTTAEEEE